ncbi:MAG: CPBP family intramembrane metalloprotease [Sinomonas sp.]|nr:CPBP family intramembrane metalloprotease [Sinomonas sp.]
MTIADERRGRISGPAGVSGRSVLAVLGLWIGGSAVLATAGYLATQRLAAQDAEAPTLVAVFIAFGSLPFAALVVFGARGMREHLAVRAPAGRQLGLGLLVGLVVLAVAALVYGAIGAAGGDLAGPALELVRDATDLSRFATATPLDWALIIPRALILAGVAEELLFRGILFGWLARHLPVWAVILVTAALFAAEHAYYPVLLPVAALFGIGAGWLRARTNTIVPGLAAHILVDGAFFLIALRVA